MPWAELPERRQELVEQGHELLQETAGIEQSDDRTEQVAEQVAGPWIRFDREQRPAQRADGDDAVALPARPVIR